MWQIYCHSDFNRNFSKRIFETNMPLLFLDMWPLNRNHSLVNVCCFFLYLKKYTHYRSFFSWLWSNCLFHTHTKARDLSAVVVYRENKVNSVFAQKYRFPYFIVFQLRDQKVDIVGVKLRDNLGFLLKRMQIYHICEIVFAKKCIKQQMKWK